ncbi:MAG: plasmid mobilization relaxosome protein MobC [Oscillospiraceae bacterium]|nr:plasmid mobilization relaxosome protein MobC [Oscillospiraceae bacterium]
MAANRTRDVQLNFRVSKYELELIKKKMSQVGTKNREAYLRKMAIDGIVVNLEIPEMKELLSLMRYTSNNINQLTRRVHETGRIYDADLEDILQKQDALWNGLKEILTQLGKIS